MTIEWSLAGKTAVITGSNSGIGLGVAQQLAKAGADVVLNSFTDRDEDHALATEIAEEFGVTARYIKADMSKGEECRMLIETAGRCDILVNNAGIIRRADAVDFTEQDWDDVLDTNLKALFFTCQAFARAAIARQSGKIINIASLLSYQGGIRVPSYTASKHGVNGITQALANEWAVHNINVNAVAPGYIKTNNTQALQDDAARNTSILERIPAGRWGNAADIAGAVVFLASDAAAYIHGTTLAVDGGWMGR